MQFYDLHNPNYSTSIAQLMAKFHSLEMPFIKEPHWLFDTTKKYIRQTRECVFTNELDINRYQQLMDYHLDAEFAQLK